MNQSSVMFLQMDGWSRRGIVAAWVGLPWRTMRTLPYSVQILIVAACYFVAGRLGLLLAIPPGYATPVWAPSGIALAGVLLFGRRVWPGVWAGSFLANLATSFPGAETQPVWQPVVVSAGIGIGAVFQSVLGAVLIRRAVTSENPLYRITDTGKFLMLGGPVSCLVNSTWSVTGLWLIGGIPPTDYAIHWWTWWLGDVAGVLVVAPFVLAWLARPFPVLTRQQALLALLMPLLLFVVGQMAFAGWLPLDDPRYPLGFIPIPLIIWAAYQFGPRGATVAILMITVIVIRGTMQGTGLFARDSLNESLLLVQGYVSVIGCAAHLLAAAVIEREMTERKLRESESFFQSSLNSLVERIAVLDESGVIVAVNDAWRRGGKDRSFLGSECSVGDNFLEACRHSDGVCSDVSTIVEGIEGVIRRRRPAFQTEYGCETLSGRRWLTLHITRFEGSSGIRVVLAQEDISDRKLVEEQLLRMARQDPLTGAANRAVWMEAMREALARKAAVPDYHFAVLFLDLDEFKAVNDQYGHSVGDQLLIALARRVQGCLRKSDCLARIGGDEFLILLDDIQGRDEARLIAERIQSDVRAPYFLEGRSLQINASIGIAGSDRDCKSAEEFVRMADQAMYRAKRAETRLSESGEA